MDLFVINKVYLIIPDINIYYSIMPLLQYIFLGVALSTTYATTLILIVYNLTLLKTIELGKWVMIHNIKVQKLEKISIFGILLVFIIRNQNMELIMKRITCLAYKIVTKFDTTLGLIVYVDWKVKLNDGPKGTHTKFLTVLIVLRNQPRIVASCKYLLEWSDCLDQSFEPYKPKQFIVF